MGAVWLFLIAATGSILVFYEEIDRALNPDLFTASSGAPQPLDRVAAAALAGHPDKFVRYIDIADNRRATHLVYLAQRPDAPEEAKASAWQMFVDPATARVLGARDYDAIDLSRRGITSFVYKLHYSMHLGEWMAWLLGLLSLLWVVDHAVAAALSFPNAARWRESFRIRRAARGHKRIFDLHRAIGLWLFPVTLTLAVSGVYFNWHEEFKMAVNAISPLTPRIDEQRQALAEPLLAPPIGFDEAVGRAGSAQVDGLAFNAAKGLYWLRVYDQRDIDPYGRRWIFVDAHDGRIMSDTHAADGSGGDVLLAWQFPLHSGKALGWPGRIAIFVTGIATCMFVVTGLLMWARKQSARRTRRHGSASLASIPAE